MIYKTLAHYYDALVKDEQATQLWADFVEDHMPHGAIMELACGSGEITIELANRGFCMTASDISQDMIEEANKKDGSQQVIWKQMDMYTFDDDGKYDGILCFCDSFNYLLEERQVLEMLQQVYDHLEEHGVFMMDMHALDRLAEFEEDYNETGNVMGREYQWTITTQEDRILQTFAFYDEDGKVELEQHEQRVYDTEWLITVLKEQGFIVEIYTDFHQSGIHPGEKQFFICRKVCE